MSRDFITQQCSLHWERKVAEAERIARLERWEQVSNFRFPEVLKERGYNGNGYL